MAVLNSFLQVFIVLGRYNFVSISTTTWQGASDELSMILLYAFGKCTFPPCHVKVPCTIDGLYLVPLFPLTLPLLSTFLYFLRYYRVPQGKVGFFITSLLIRNIWISIQIMAEITSEGLIFTTEIYEFLTRSQYSWDIGHTFVTYSIVYCC